MRQTGGVIGAGTGPVSLVPASRPEAQDLHEDASRDRQRPKPGEVIAGAAPPVANLLDLMGRVALVTAGSGGIGAGTAGGPSREGRASVG